MTNYDFIDEFITDPTRKAVNGHMYCVDGELVLYSTPICVRRLDGGFTVNSSKISATTSKIQSYILRALERHGCEYDTVKAGINGYYWNCGYQGAPNWTVRELKERGIF